MCEHIFEIVREPHQAIREFVVELRCVHCAVRKYVEVTSDNLRDKEKANSQGEKVSQDKEKANSQGEKVSQSQLRRLQQSGLNRGTISDAHVNERIHGHNLVS